MTPEEKKRLQQALTIKGQLTNKQWQIVSNLGWKSEHIQILKQSYEFLGNMLIDPGLTIDEASVNAMMEAQSAIAQRVVDIINHVVQPAE